MINPRKLRRSRPSWTRHPACGKTSRCPPTAQGSPPPATGGLHPRTVLVGMETARALLGVDADGVQARVDAGRLRWVWDISARPGPAAAPRWLRAPRSRSTTAKRADPGCSVSDHRPVRELRLWARELAAPDLFDRLRLRQVLPMILGQERRRWRSGEVARLLLCSRPAMKRLAETGQLTGSLRDGIRWFTRDTLASFLTRRLLRPALPKPD
jgi:hypothetical protein